MYRFLTVILVSMLLQACDSSPILYAETQNENAVSLNQVNLWVNTIGNAKVVKRKNDISMEGLGDCTLNDCASQVIFKASEDKKADFHLQFLPIEMTEAQSIFMTWGNSLPSFKTMNGEESFAQGHIYQVGDDLYIKQKFSNPAINFVDLIYYNNDVEVARIKLPKGQVEDGIPVNIGYEGIDKIGSTGVCWVASSGGTKANPIVDFDKKMPCTKKNNQSIENINIEFKPDISLAGKHDAHTFQKHTWMSVGTQNIPEITLKEIK